MILSRTRSARAMITAIATVTTAASISAFIARTCRARFVVQTHGQADTRTRNVNFHHFDFNQLAGFHHFARVFDVGIGQRGDMHQPILMHADVDKRAKIRDVGNHAFEHHAFAQVFNVLDAIAEGRCFELAAWVAPCSWRTSTCRSRFSENSAS